MNLELETRKRTLISASINGNKTDANLDKFIELKLKSEIIKNHTIKNIRRKNLELMISN